MIINILLILDNLASLPMIIVGFILDNLIISLRTPVGFIVALYAIIFAEAIVIKSIAKDPNKIKFKSIFNYTKNNIKFALNRSVEIINYSHYRILYMNVFIARNFLFLPY